MAANTTGFSAAANTFQSGSASKSAIQQAAQIGMHFPESFAGVAARNGTYFPHLWVLGQQPQQFTAAVSGTAENADAGLDRHHV